MIDLHARLHVTYLALDAIRFPTTAHWPAPLSLDQLRHYVALLTERPDQETDPIMVAPCGDAYTITNGRHRFVAHCIAGRRTIAAVIVTPPDQEAP